ncbi:hypothetical protein LTR50_003708 [Elasticomyces elasticus]|nr:hypothetical protein LTR50_003708 [Elasticomyces elasticus]
MASEELLRQMLPPVTDYPMFVIFLEQNLTPDLLPTLHELLQDVKLAQGTGWDLVQLLLPVLPASEACLIDIARLGNPKEVILKVAEALSAIDFDAEEDDGPAEQVEDGAATLVPPLTEDNDLCTTSSVLQFQTLVSMLAILHPRITVKRPSRFLSTTLQSLLTAFRNGMLYQQELITPILQFVRTIAKSSRPALPPRASSNKIPLVTTTGTEPDPEPQPGSPSAQEFAIIRRLLQSLLSHVTEDYSMSMVSTHGFPGFAWCTQIQERTSPQWVVPGKMTYADLIRSDKDLRKQSETMAELLSVAKELGLDLDRLWQAVCRPEFDEDLEPTSSEEADPPSSVEEIPLSATGSLLLYTGLQVGQVLVNEEHDAGQMYALHVFPQHAQVLSIFQMGTAPHTATEHPLVLCDAVLVLGLISAHYRLFGFDYTLYEGFRNYLLATATLSATTLSPSLRWHAHHLTSSILESHPNDYFCLGFIWEVLEDPQHESLKGSAVTWVKDTVVKANNQQAPADPKRQLFTRPETLEVLAPFLFPDLKHLLVLEITAESWKSFSWNQLPFLLQALNFYYLLLSARYLLERLRVAQLTREHDIPNRLIAPLRKVHDQYVEALREGKLDAELGVDGAAADLQELMLLEDVLDRVITALGKLQNEVA